MHPFLVFIYYITQIKNNFINTITIAPGIPKIPTKIEVIKFNPIWNSKKEPIKLIINIINPPSTEFITNLHIIFIGTINILPNINKKNIHAMYVIILLKSILNHSPIFILYLSFNNITINKFYAKILNNLILI